MSYSAIPKEIILRLHQRYDEDDIAVLADWCAEMGAEKWFELLSKKADDSPLARWYQAHAVILIGSAYFESKVRVYSAHTSATRSMACDLLFDWDHA